MDLEGQQKMCACQQHLTGQAGRNNRDMRGRDTSLGPLVPRGHSYKLPMTRGLSPQVTPAPRMAVHSAWEASQLSAPDGRGQSEMEWWRPKALPPVTLV